MKCVSNIGDVVDDEECNMKLRPNDIENCDMGPCAKSWFLTEWSERVSCGRAERASYRRDPGLRHPWAGPARPRRPSPKHRRPWLGIPKLAGGERLSLLTQRPRGCKGEPAARLQGLKELVLLRAARER